MTRRKIKVYSPAFKVYAYEIRIKEIDYTVLKSTVSFDTFVPKS